MASDRKSAVSGTLLNTAWMKSISGDLRSKQLGSNAHMSD
jgi:hypothetical protein